jgi:hypothetical protein
MNLHVDICRFREVACPGQFTSKEKCPYRGSLDTFLEHALCCPGVTAIKTVAKGGVWGVDFASDCPVVLPRQDLFFKPLMFVGMPFKDPLARFPYLSMESLADGGWCFIVKTFATVDVRQKMTVKIGAKEKAKGLNAGTAFTFAYSGPPSAWDEVDTTIKEEGRYLYLTPAHVKRIVDRATNTFGIQIQIQ